MNSHGVIDMDCNPSRDDFHDKIVIARIVIIALAALVLVRDILILILSEVSRLGIFLFQYAMLGWLHDPDNRVSPITTVWI